MLSRRATRTRTERYVRRRPDDTRPHGRRRGYEHGRVDQAPERHERAPRLAGGAVILAGVLLFLLFIVGGGMEPAKGPLAKYEPVSTARAR